MNKLIFSTIIFLTLLLVISCGGASGGGASTGAGTDPSLEDQSLGYWLTTSSYEECTDSSADGFWQYDELAACYNLGKVSMRFEVVAPFTVEPAGDSSVIITPPTVLTEGSLVLYMYSPISSSSPTQMAIYWDDLPGCSGEGATAAACATTITTAASISLQSAIVAAPVGDGTLSITPSSTFLKLVYASEAAGSDANTELGLNPLGSVQYQYCDNMYTLYAGQELLNIVSASYVLHVSVSDVVGDYPCTAARAMPAYFDEEAGTFELRGAESGYNYEHNIFDMFTDGEVLLLQNGTSCDRFIGVGKRDSGGSLTIFAPANAATYISVTTTIDSFTIAPTDASNVNTAIATAGYEDVYFDSYTFNIRNSGDVEYTFHGVQYLWAPKADSRCYDKDAVEVSYSISGCGSMDLGGGGGGNSTSGLLLILIPLLLLVYLRVNGSRRLAFKRF